MTGRRDVVILNEVKDLFITIPAYAMLCEQPDNPQFAEQREQKQEQEQGLRLPRILPESTLLSDCSCFCFCSLQIPIWRDVRGKRFVQILRSAQDDRAARCCHPER